MKKRTGYKVTLTCCHQTVYRPAWPGAGLIHCHWCDRTLPPAEIALYGGIEGTCPRGHQGRIRDSRGALKCPACARENTRRWRSKVA